MEFSKIHSLVGGMDSSQDQILVTLLRKHFLKIMLLLARGECRGDSGERGLQELL